jgi:hypothetical protein
MLLEKRPGMKFCHFDWQQFWMFLRVFSETVVVFYQHIPPFLKDGSVFLQPSLRWVVGGDREGL